MNQECVGRHHTCRTGTTNIGYGLRPEDPREVAATGAPNAGDMAPSDFESYKRFVSDYPLERAVELSGVEPSPLEALAELYADPARKVMSLWNMGFNQPERGVWANHQSRRASRRARVWR